MEPIKVDSSFFDTLMGYVPLLQRDAGVEMLIGDGYVR